MDCERQRNKQQLSYAELGRRMGVSRAYVSKLMSGMQNSTIGSLVKLAVALGCEVDVSLRVPPSARAATAPLLKFPSTKQKASAPRKDMAPKRARVRKPAKGVPAAARKPKG
ncbi:helix-turn-helix domain-containing protein [bacterium]|nr:helix-turn-helix domain-containing protein [bacterium]